MLLQREMPRQARSGTGDGICVVSRWSSLKGSDAPRRTDAAMRELTPEGASSQSAIVSVVYLLHLSATDVTFRVIDDSGKPTTRGRL